MMGIGEVLIPKEEHTNCFLSAKWSSLETSLQVILWGLSKLYLGIFICIYTYAITISEKIDHDFESERVGVCQKV